MLEQLQKLQVFSTPEISDALDACGIEGALLGIKPLSQGMTCLGPAYTVQYVENLEKPSTFKQAANYIDSVSEGSVIVIDNHGLTHCTAWGDILTQVAILKGLAGTVVHGAVRDVASLRSANYPVFCQSVHMRSGKNRIHKLCEQQPVTINGVTINPGDIIFGDDNGVLAIPRHSIDEIIVKAANIRLTEQKILTAVRAGSSLEKAREKYRYDQPWSGS
jgi:regulator of RNase E activity RraA